MVDNQPVKSGILAVGFTSCEMKPTILYLFNWTSYNVMWHGKAGAMCFAAKTETLREIWQVKMCYIKTSHVISIAFPMPMLESLPTFKNVCSVPSHFQRHQCNIIQSAIWWALLIYVRESFDRTNPCYVFHCKFNNNPHSHQYSHQRPVSPDLYLRLQGLLRLTVDH